MKVLIRLCLTFLLQFVDELALPEQHGVLLMLRCFLLQDTGEYVSKRLRYAATMVPELSRVTGMIHNSVGRFKFPVSAHLQFLLRTSLLSSFSQLKQSKVKSGTLPLAVAAAPTFVDFAESAAAELFDDFEALLEYFLSV